MKYAVKMVAVLDTKAKQDNLLQSIKDKIVGKMLWANSQNQNSVSAGLSEDGKSAINASLRFDSKAERDEVAAYVKGKINQLPALSGTIQLHRCFHDEGNGNDRQCEPEEDI